MKVVFCIDSPLCDWREIFDRNDSFVYYAKQFAKVCETYMVLTWPEDVLKCGGCLSLNSLLLSVVQEENLASHIKEINPDVIVHLGSFERPFNEVMAREFPKAFKILFWAGGPMIHNNVALFDHIAVHHPWQPETMAELNGMDESLFSDIQGGVDLTMFTPNLELRQKRAIYPSNILTPKRQHLSAEACSLIDLPLFLCGYTVEQNYADHLSTFKGVTVSPRIPHNELTTEYQRSLVVPITSISEAGPFVMYEALSCGVAPLVMNDCYSTATTMRYLGLHSLVCDPNPQEIAYLINEVVENGTYDPRRLRAYAEHYYDANKKLIKLREMIEREVGTTN